MKINVACFTNADISYPGEPADGRFFGQKWRNLLTIQA